MFKRVLIVDDDPIHIEVAATLLRRHGASEVFTASNGREACRLVSEETGIEIMLLDLNMPDMDGIEFLDHLKNIACKTPIIIVSAADRRIREVGSQLAEAYGLQFAGIIEKPLTAAKLDAALASHFS